MFFFLLVPAKGREKILLFISFKDAERWNFFFLLLPLAVDVFSVCIVCLFTPREFLVLFMSLNRIPLNRIPLNRIPLRLEISRTR